jgi:photosystem II stability/assembly factor-like uncharacterized protein
MHARIAALLVFALAGCSSTVTITPPRVTQGGRSLSIAMASTTQKQMVVATETGGLFRTYDGGTSWQHLDGLPNYKTIDVAIAWTDPNTIIATTQSQYRAVNDGGIWRSTDGGGTWSQPTGWATPGPHCPDRPSAYGISHMPLSKTFYVGTDCGLAVSNDNGATWTNVIPDPGAQSGATFTNRVHSVLVINRTTGVAVGDRALWHLDGSGNWVPATSNPDNGQTPPTHGFAAPWWNGVPVIFHASVGQKLFASTDGGANWTQVNAPSVNNREAWVRVARALSNDDNEFDIYYGDGAKLNRQTLSFSNPASVGEWTRLASDHDDPSDIAFDLDRREPVLLASDGGVHITADHGAHWTLTGGNYGGFVALQISEITGQSVGGDHPHLDLYYGTQDNDLKASDDGGQTWTGSICCEGRFIRTMPQSDAPGSRVTLSACGPCGNTMAGAHFESPTGWPNAPGGAADMPFLIVEDAYLQNVVSSATPPSNDYFLTLSAGATWAKSFSLTPTPKGATIFAGSLANPSVYTGVQRPGSLPNGGTHFGLMRAKNIAGTATVADADNGIMLGSLRVPIARYIVFGVDPKNPEHLIAPDADAEVMKFSADGGASWHPLPQLTNAVTGNGAYQFELGDETLASVVAFDPYDSCHILVGTIQNGIVRSTDGGNTWAQIDGSKHVTFVSSFFFPPTGDVWVSSNGRGLWTLKLNRQANADSHRCQFPVPPGRIPPVAPPIAIDAGGASHDFHGLDDPVICPECHLVVVRDGWITDLDRSDGTLRGFAISGGSVAEIDRSGREVALAIPNTYKPGNGRLERAVKGIAANDTRRIRAIVLEGTTVKAVIASEQPLALAPARTPRVFVQNADARATPSVVQSGESVRVSGADFVPGSPVTIRFDGVDVRGDVAVGADGTFSVTLPVAHVPGELDVTVEQRDGKRVTVEHATIDVSSADEEEKPRAV